MLGGLALVWRMLSTLTEAQDAKQTDNPAKKISRAALRSEVFMRIGVASKFNKR
jgi:hypothetical protein